ncbi:hypothetical protein GH714_027113 [Hevea brasiliensis]|uniref:Uncharacterized protein n=1 Tax=Hevea brasiliensis TaxID=3981 RepID=A0A6A6MDN6_HEVBR|nr:hypothetical protein GH714_027113 [Hevea brasiliensis]
MDKGRLPLVPPHFQPLDMNWASSISGAMCWFHSAGPYTPHGLHFLVDVAWLGFFPMQVNVLAPLAASHALHLVALVLMVHSHWLILMHMQPTFTSHSSCSTTGCFGHQVSRPHGVGLRPQLSLSWAETLEKFVGYLDTDDNYRPSKRYRADFRLPASQRSYDDMQSSSGRSQWGHSRVHVPMADQTDDYPYEDEDGDEGEFEMYRVQGTLREWVTRDESKRPFSINIEQVSNASNRESVSSQEKEGSITLKYPMLTKSNYAAWAIKMEVFMIAQGVWEPIESEGPVDQRKDKMALAAIYQGIGEDTLLQLGAKKTAKEAWNMLKIKNQGAEKVKEVRTQTLWREFEALGMSDSETIDDFSGKLTIIVNKLRSLGNIVEDEKVIKKLLRSSSSKFLQIVSAIEEFSDLKTKSVEEVIGSLKAHEERLLGCGGNSAETVLLTRAEWKAREEGSFQESSK